MDSFLGHAAAGNRLRFSPGSNSGPPLPSSSLYTTEREQLGYCPYGSQCQFAHRREEPCPLIRHPKYRSEVCKSFATMGACMCGGMCHINQQAIAREMAKQEQSNMSMARITKEEESTAELGDESLEAFMDDIGVPYTSSDKKEEELMYNIVRGPRRRSRLPIFEEICPRNAKQ